MFVYVAKKDFPENHLSTGDVVALSPGRIEAKYDSQDFQEVVVPDEKVSAVSDDQLRYWRYDGEKFRRKTAPEIEAIDTAQRTVGEKIRAAKVARILKEAGAEDPRIGEALAQAIIAAGYGLRKE